MAITKKKRFEIFKRDGFRCGYCGRQPPEVTLEIDHVIPRSDGGADDAENLITSCFDCNRGKAADSLDLMPSTLVERTQLIIEREEQYKAYQRAVRSAKARRKREIARVEAVFTTTFEDREFTDSFRRSVNEFIEKLGGEQVIDAIQLACDRMTSPDSACKYFCGICWRKIRDR